MNGSRPNLRDPLVRARRNFNRRGLAMAHWWDQAALMKRVSQPPAGLVRQVLLLP